MNALMKDTKECPYYHGYDVIKMPPTVSGVSTVRGKELKNGRKVNGYLLNGDGGEQLALIETTRPHPRIEELLMHYAATSVYQARALMRDLLNTEDYRSDIYDVIVRVHYAEDFRV